MDIPAVHTLWFVGKGCRNMNVINYFVVVSLLVLCDGVPFGKKLLKCNLDDSDCMRFSYESIISSIGKTGIPALGIPPVDPVALKNVTVAVFNAYDFTLVDGIAKGIKGCTLEKLRLNIINETGYQANRCDFVLKGRYKVKARRPLLEEVLEQNTVHGEGNLNVKIDKLHMKFEFPIYVENDLDNETYLKYVFDDVKYNYDIGNIVFYVDNIYLGRQDVSKTMTDLLNNNWPFVMSTFGRPFMNKAMEFYFKLTGIFFNAVPARHFIVEDLTSYAQSIE